MIKPLLRKTILRLIIKIVDNDVKRINIITGFRTKSLKKKHRTHERIGHEITGNQQRGNTSLVRQFPFMQTITKRRTNNNNNNKTKVNDTNKNNTGKCG